MKLTVFGSSSSGNAYALEFENGQILLLEAGMPYKLFAKAFPGRWSDVLGCLITHEHGDHSKYINEYIDAGLHVFASKGTYEKLGITTRFKINVLTGGCIVSMKPNVLIYPFAVSHNAAEPLGFMITDSVYHETLVFITDSAYLDYRFTHINYYMVECNYIDSVVMENRVNGGYTAPKYHMSLETCKKFLGKCEHNDTKKIILIHLSDTNSYERRMVEEIQDCTGISTVAAASGMVIELNGSPF